MDTDIFEKALLFAADAHRGMIRKAEKLPFIMHPMEVAVIAATMSRDPELLAAALLHDTVEDTPVTMEEILGSFGERVAGLVASETENKRNESPAGQTWMVRKTESLQVLSEADDPGVRILWLSDKLSNARSFARLKKQYGDAFWDGFNQKDPLMQEWYYREVGRLTESLHDTEAWQEYMGLLDIIFDHEEETK